MRADRIAVVLSTLMVLSIVVPAVGGAAAASGAAVDSEPQASPNVTATGSSGFVSMTASVGTDQPIVDESFPVTVSITNAEDSSGDYGIRRIVVRNATDEATESESDQGSRIARNYGDLGSVEPGETVERSVDVTLNESGEHTVEVEVTLEDPAGFSRTIVQPMTIDVHDPHPQLEVSTTPARSGEWRTLSVTVENGLTDPVRQVAVSVGGEDVDYREDRKVTAELGSGGATTFEFPARVAENGERPVTVELAYTTADGDRREVTRTITTEFSARTAAGDHPQVSIDAASAVENAWRPVNVTVANGLSEEVRQVGVDVESDAVTFDTQRKVTASMGPGESRQFTFSGRAEGGRHDVTVVLTYTTENGVNRRVERTMTVDFTPPDNPGRIRLTGVSVRPSRGTVQISGSTSNVGGEAVQSVIVEVADEDNVEPAQPQPEFFVGEVEASDFVSFDLNARLTNNRTTVPIRVTYLVDGVEKSYVTEVDVGGAANVGAQPDAGNDGGSGGGFAFVGLIVLVVALVGVVGVGYVGYRFVRG